MAYLTQNELESLGFKSLGKNVKISTKASLYNPELMVLGNNCRIDDFCVVSGNVRMGDNVTMAPFCLVAGGSKLEDLENGGIIIENNVVFAYGVKVFSRSDDYLQIVNKETFIKSVKISRDCIIGTNSVIFPGSYLGEFCSIGAMSFVKGECKKYGVYVGIPAKFRRFKLRGGGAVIAFFAPLLLKVA
ncbi:acyltransferase [Helicobacter pullorum]|uniref:acyltransferase n=1 Tax=Helicobacter pullorum TaxID=35818 RepID=UPI00255C75B1|nr:acetyltransferase [Helicobacter pullorum]